MACSKIEHPTQATVNNKPYFLSIFNRRSKSAIYFSIIPPIASCTNVTRIHLNFPPPYSHRPSVYIILFLFLFLSRMAIDNARTRVLYISKSRVLYVGAIISFMTHRPLLLRNISTSFCNSAVPPIALRRT